MTRSAPAIRLQHVLVGAARDVLGVGHVADRATPVLDAVGRGAVGVVEGGRARPQAGPEVERLARAEVGEDEPGPHHVEGHREHRLVHVARERLADAAGVAEVPGEHPEGVVGLEGGSEEGEAGHVVPVRVAEEEVGLARPLAPQVLAEGADAGARRRGSGSSRPRAPRRSSCCRRSPCGSATGRRCSREPPRSGRSRPMLPCARMIGHSRPRSLHVTLASGHARDLARRRGPLSVLESPRMAGAPVPRRAARCRRSRPCPPPAPVRRRRDSCAVLDPVGGGPYCWPLRSLQTA